LAPYTVLTPVTISHGGSCWVVFDDEALRNARGNPGGAWGAGTWSTDTLLTAVSDGKVLKADSVTALAAAAGLPSAALAATVERYNQDCLRGLDSEFFKDPAQLTPIRSAPFYALELRPSIVALTGYGVRIDPDARVLGSADSRPVPGLYAAGEVTGNVLGPQYLGGGNAIGSAMIFGRIAGQSAVADQQGPDHY
jgi:succinate dehydrogenase/fumarate reductase flavoprotein subunit